MIRTVIIDDEPYVRDQIASIVESLCPNVCIAAQAEDVSPNVAAINEHQPDLILLDIKMPDGNGFDLLKHFDKPGFKVIIVSGYMEYAIKGYKFSIIDYILQVNRLRATIFREINYPGKTLSNLKNPSNQPKYSAAALNWRAPILKQANSSAIRKTEKRGSLA